MYIHAMGASVSLSSVPSSRPEGPPSSDGAVPWSDGKRTLLLYVTGSCHVQVGLLSWPCLVGSCSRSLPFVNCGD